MGFPTGPQYAAGSINTDLQVQKANFYPRSCSYFFFPHPTIPTVRRNRTYPYKKKTHPSPEPVDAVQTEFREVKDNIARQHRNTRREKMTDSKHIRQSKKTYEDGS